MFPIITAEQRMKEKRGIKGCIFGKSGIGKTSLLLTLPAEKTLFLDLEAGDLAVKEWKGNMVVPKTWEECRNLACYIGGPNISLRPGQCYSQSHYAEMCARFGDPSLLDQYDTIFIDSITVAGRLCFNYCKGQNQVTETKSGKLDTRAAYGLHGQEMISWLTHLQHTRGKNIWFVGILDEKLDEYNNKLFCPQIEGSKTGLELPGIVDQVITMTEVVREKTKFRAFVCQTINEFGLPAKDRSGKLDVLEEPNLGRLMDKILNGKRKILQPKDHEFPEEVK